MEYKYNCEKCNYHTNAKSLYDKHIITGKHLTGKRHERCDKKMIDKCPHCEYKTNTMTNMLQHMLNNHSTKNERKEKFKYYCEYCDYGTFGKKLFENHKLTQKHILVMKLVDK